MKTVGLVVRLDAKPGKEDELAVFLRGALALVQEEPQTLTWLAVRGDDSSFAIIDSFADEAGRQAHLAGRVAAALIRRRRNCSPDRRRSNRSTCWPPSRRELRRRRFRRARPHGRERGCTRGRHPARLVTER